MKAVIRALLLAGMLLAGTVLPVVASNTSGALYVATVRITNTAGDNTSESVPFTLSTAELISAGQMDSAATLSALITNAGADTAYQPGWGANPWAVYTPSINANGILDYKLYLGGDTAMSGKIRYFPGSGGMTASDNASLEVSDNFSISQSVFFDADTAGNLIDKTDAINVAGDGAGGITATIENSTMARSPTGDGLQDGTWNTAPYWSKVDEYPAASDADYFTGTTFVGGYQLLTFSGFDLSTEATNITLTVYFRAQEAAAGANNIAACIRVGGTNYSGGSVDPGAWATNSYAWTTNPDTAAAWTPADINGTGANPLQQMGVISTDLNPAVDVSQIYAIVTYDLPVTASGIATGERDITVRGVDNDPQWATGDVLHFTKGVASNLDAGVIYDSATKLWVSLWFKNDVALPDGAGTYVIFSKWLDTNNRFWVYMNRNTGSVYFIFTKASVNQFSIQPGGNFITDTNWHHLIASISSVNGARLVIDGTAYTDANTVALYAGGNFVIGDRQVGNGGGMTGLIANVITGTDDLTAGEETDLRNGTVPADAVDYWYMDEGIGTDIISYGTGGNDGTAGAATAWQTATYTTGSTGRLADFTIGVDSERWGVNLKGASVPDNANDWEFFTGGVAPYVESHQITVGGTLVQSIAWQYGATFTDLSGNGNDATPTFRTTSTNAAISAELIDFVPISPAQASGWSLSTAGTAISTAPTMDSDFYSTGGFGSGNPFILIGNSMIQGSGIPLAQVWYPLAVLLLCFLGLFIGHYSLAAQVIVMVAGFFFISGWLWSPWLGIMFIIPALATLMLSREFAS